MKRAIHNYIRLAFFIPAMILFWGCGEDEVQDEKTWTLVWEDNFNGSEGQSPDASNWTFNIGTDWGNRQLEYDTDRPENVSLDGQGNLLITAREENFYG